MDDWPQAQPTAGRNGGGGGGGSFFVLTLPLDQSGKGEPARDQGPSRHSSKGHWASQLRHRVKVITHGEEMWDSCNIEINLSFLDLDLRRSRLVQLEIRRLESLLGPVYKERGLP